MKHSDLIWKIEVWLLDFDNKVDAHFSSGNSSKGESAYLEWHESIRRSLSDVDDGIGRAFDRTGRNRQALEGTGAKVTPRAQFMRQFGSPAKAYLKRLKTELQRRGRSDES